MPGFRTAAVLGNFCLQAVVAQQPSFFTNAVPSQSCLLCITRDFDPMTAGCCLNSRLLAIYAMLFQMLVPCLLSVPSSVRVMTGEFKHAVALLGSLAPGRWWFVSIRRHVVTLPPIEDRHAVFGQALMAENGPEITCHTRHGGIATALRLEHTSKG